MREKLMCWLAWQKHLWWDVRRTKLIIWVVWKLPRGLVYWCSIRLLSAATVPPYGDQVVPELTGMVALQRWES